MQGSIQLPALGTFDAVRDRKILSFLAGEIIVCMGVQCRIDVLLGIGENLLSHLLYDVSGLLCAERAVNKVLLHIDYNQNLLHLPAFLKPCKVLRQDGKSVIGSKSL